MRHILGLAGLVVCATLACGADVKELVKQLKDGDNDARRAAARALADGGAESKEAVPALIQALKDRDTFVRRFSAQALGEIGPEAQSAVPALATALDDPKKEVQSAAASALGKLGPSGVETLVGIVKNGKKDSTIRRQAITCLGSIGVAGRPAVPALTEVVKEKPPGKGKNKNLNAPEDLRIEAANALSALATAEDKETIETLQALTDKKAKTPRNLRQAANMALRKIQSNQ
jgi:HEAT repeat protein